jgi:hypothetical protein
MADSRSGQYLCRSSVFIAVAAPSSTVHGSGARSVARSRFPSLAMSPSFVDSILRGPAASWRLRGAQQTSSMCNVGVVCIAHAPTPAAVFARSQPRRKAMESEDGRACQQLALQIGCGTPCLCVSNIAPAFCIGAAARSGQDSMYCGCANRTPNKVVEPQVG